MPFPNPFRRTSPDDPRGRSWEADRAVKAALGLPMPAVTAITDIVRGPVTAHVADGLPGVAHSTGPRGLVTYAAGVKIPIMLAQTLRPDLSYGHAAAAALPAMHLHVIAMELIRRYDVSGPAVPYERFTDAGPPEPPEALRSAHAELRFRRDDGPAAHRDAGVTLARAMLAGPGRPHADAWAGWTLVGADVALNAHQHLLPAPGRARPRPADKRAGADAAGFAFQLGRSVLGATAASLVELAGDG
jgi:hypothetical protein